MEADCIISNLKIAACMVEELRRALRLRVIWWIMSTHVHAERLCSLMLLRFLVAQRKVVHLFRHSCPHVHEERYRI